MVLLNAVRSTVGNSTSTSCLRALSSPSFERDEEKGSVQQLSLVGQVERDVSGWRLEVVPIGTVPIFS